MPDLKHSLSKMDFNHLKIIAEKWRLPFSAPDVREGLNQLVALLLDNKNLKEIPEILSPQEKEVLLWLDLQGGKEPWSHFSRRFGEVREMGAGRMDRERPDQNPISPVETLWYRALIARGFFETDSGLLEFAYIPDDVRKLVMDFLRPESLIPQAQAFLCRKAVPQEKEHLQLSSTIGLDHICTLLAGLRMKLDSSPHLLDVAPGEIHFYRALFSTLNLLGEDGAPAPENIRDYFDLPLEEAFLLLWRTWRTSYTHQDLVLIPDLQIEALPDLDPGRVREMIIGNLKDLDPDTWWSLESFVSQVKDLSPDFQRTAGDYDSWYIKRKSTGEFLRGFKHWDDVEGALIKYLIVGPLFWLGLLDLGMPDENAQPAAFRLSAYAKKLLNNRAPDLPSRKPERVQIRSKGEIRMTVNVPHKIRYQVARFCEWHPVKAEAYIYTVSPNSLNRAEKQGLRVAHLISLLKKHAEAIPPNILVALERWEKQGVQASIANKTILRLGSPAMLKSLKKSKANRFILEQLGPTAVIIKEGSEDKIAEALVELGFFLED
ncbi:MAG: hypothetical protein WBB69_08785 [Anaerolineales bacterium]